jgi:tetratricopeptide (TPR) repeat protein
MRSTVALILTVAAITVSSSLAQAENHTGSNNSAYPQVLPPLHSAFPQILAPLKSAFPQVLTPPKSETRLKAGIQAYNMGQYEDSTRFFSAIISREPKNDYARYYLALSLHGLRQFQTAETQYVWLAQFATTPDIRVAASNGELLVQAELQAELQEQRQAQISHSNAHRPWPESKWKPPCKKPVIYLYPQVTEKVKVELKYKGGLRATYPAYDRTLNGWSVTARPDGTLVNNADGKEYSYLFWDGKGCDFPVDTGEGFVVKGSETAQFLQATLKRLGLTPREYNEFIVYWLPQMQDNRYNFIHFAGREYTDVARLTVTPQPDSVLRVFMIYRPLKKSISVKEQALPSFHRHGFAVVEWGGCEIGH